MTFRLGQAAPRREPVTTASLSTRMDAPTMTFRMDFLRARMNGRQRRRQHGQGLIEYALIFGLVAIVLIAIVRVVGSNTAYDLCKVSRTLNGACTVYVVNTSDSTIQGVSIGAGSPNAQSPIAGSNFGTGLAITPDGKTAVVAGGTLTTGYATPVTLTAGGGTVGIPIAVGSAPYAVAISPDGKTAFVESWGSTGGPGILFDAIDLTANPPAVKAGYPIVGVGGSQNMVISKDGKTGYLVAWPLFSTYGAVYPVDLTTSPATIKAGASIYGASYIALSADGKTAYTTDYNNNAVTPVDLTVSPPVAGSDITGGGFNHTEGIAVSPDGKTAYVVDSDHVTAMPLPQTAGAACSGCVTINGSFNNPQGIAITPDGKTAYVTNDASPGSITPISLTPGGGTAGTPISVGNGPIAIAIS